MPAPTTVDEFVDLVRKSAVLEEPRLSSFVQKIKTDPNTPADLSGVAGLFVRDGLLTYFQAEQFLQGKWKRFSIGKYKVLERLGSGGMGQVFLCEHKLMRRRVAVKVLPINKANDPSSLERFYREARAVAALDHPNIVRAYDIDQDDNLHFLVMEYVDGASLQEMIKKSGPMDPVRACHYMYWSAVGLQHAHAAGLIHRDIKPGNILVDRGGTVKILDLGLARFFNDDDDLLTKKYDESVLGTADYLAPEQAIDSHAVDGRADIYSLGATFYFLLTGQPPFAEGSVAQKLLWHQTRTPKPVRDLRPEVPAEILAVLDRMMAKKPDDRYATPADLAAALQPFTLTPIPPPPDSEMPQLSAAAQGSSAGPVSVMAVPPRTIVAPPARTPQPASGPRAKPPTGSASGPKPLPPPPPVPPAPTPAPQPAVAVAEADTQRNPPAPLVEPIPDSSADAPVWESLGADTANAARADTDTRRRDGKSSRRLKGKLTDSTKAGVKPASDKAESGRPRKQPRAGKRLPPRLLLAAAGGLVLLLTGAFSIYWFGLRDRSKPTGVQPPAEARTLILSRNAGSTPLHFDSLQKALAEFRPGDTIQIQDDEWEEAVAVNRHKGLVLTAAQGKRVTWKAPGNKKGSHILSLANADGARITGITFQAGSQADHAIRLSGQCPGLVLENVELTGGAVSALAIHDGLGDKARPISVRQCRFQSSDARPAVLFTSDSSGRGSGNGFVNLHDCLIEGAGNGPGVQFEGTASMIDIRHCRLWKTGSGVLFKKLLPPLTPAAAVWRVDIVGNTFHSLTGPAIRCEDPGQMKAQVKPAPHRIVLAQNFFAGLPLVFDLPGNPPPTDAKYLVVDGPTSNVRKQGTNPGYPHLPTAESPADVPTNPQDTARFLRTEPTSPLFRAVNGKPAGVPAE